MNIDWGNLITICVIIVTAILNHIRSKTKIETRLDFLAEQITKQNSRIGKLEDYNLKHLEDCHSKK